MKITKRITSTLLALLMVLTAAPTVFAMSTPGYRLVNTYDADRNIIVSELYLTGGIGSVGQLGVYYDTELISLAATAGGELVAVTEEITKMSEIITSASGITATKESNAVVDLVNEEKGEFFFAWYTSKAGARTDARAEDVKLLTFNFLVNEGADKDALEDAGDALIMFAAETPSDSKVVGYDAGAFCSNEEMKYFTNKPGAKYVLSTSVEFAGLDMEAPKAPATGGGNGGGGGAAAETFTVTYDAGENGTIESGSNNEKVASGSTPGSVPTIKANDGYEFVGWALSGTADIVNVAETKIKKNTTFTAQYKEAAKVWVNPFKDVKENDWYYESVKAASEKGLMNGVSSEEFAPDGNVTRAMFVTVLYRMHNQPEVEGNAKFSDVESGSWYEKAVIWASENGIVNGTSEAEFSPDANITREQMATMVYRYAKFNGKGFTGLWAFSPYL